ncbi:tetratricopeptide repeat protein [Herbaspirillum sp. ST 5-3]|uniref:tetratricopeptide repeat protein n=1 Tax=Oxalobacteraceae TaxID=75682 RepID=UPI0010A54690|nr:tetratricopeptide repeat protein [Herbaspirillum sp. ST 5-3]
MTILMNGQAGSTDVCGVEEGQRASTTFAVERPGGVAPEGLLPRELAKALAEVGFRTMATSHRAKSELIFTSLQRFLPDAELPVIGLALFAMSSDDPHKAVTLLENALEKMPDSLEMKALLGRAFLRAGRLDQCSLVLEQLACCDAQSSVGRYARALRNDLLYQSGPAAVHCMQVLKDSRM